MKDLKTQGHQAQPKKAQGGKDKKKTLYEVQNKRKEYTLAYLRLARNNVILKLQVDVFPLPAPTLFSSTFWRAMENE